MKAKTTNPVLLLLDGRYSKANLHDPTRQITIELLPPDCLAHHQPMTAGVLPALKSVFRYTMLNEILDVSENRVDRRKAARNAWMHADTMGVREEEHMHTCTMY